MQSGPAVRNASPLSGHLKPATSPMCVCPAGLASQFGREVGDVVILTPYKAQLVLLRRTFQRVWRPPGEPGLGLGSGAGAVRHACTEGPCRPVRWRFAPCCAAPGASSPDRQSLSAVGRRSSCFQTAGKRGAGRRRLPAPPHHQLPHPHRRLCSVEARQRSRQFSSPPLTASRAGRRMSSSSAVCGEGPAFRPSRPVPAATPAGAVWACTAHRVPLAKLPKDVARMPTVLSVPSAYAQALCLA